MIERILLIKHLCKEVFKKKKKSKVKNCINAILNIKLCSISFLVWLQQISDSPDQKEWGELLRKTPLLLLSELRILLLLLWPECPFSLQTDWLLSALPAPHHIPVLMKSLFGLDLPACKLNSGNCTKMGWFVRADPKAQIFQVNTCPGVMMIPDESLDSCLRSDPPTNWQQSLENYCYIWIKNSL